MDVNVVDGHKLEKHLSQHKGAVEDGTPPPNREPIFKLSWSAFPNSSDPRGGETALTILGGLTMGEAVGLSVHWLPAFNPPEPPATSTTGTRKGLHLFIRNAMRESLTPSNTYFYCTSGIAQDYLLIPRESPHFSGAFDPISILILSEAEGDSRVVEAYQFPPPTFLATAEEADQASKGETRDAADLSECLVDTLASTLKSLEMNDEPQRLRLPTSLLNGSSGLLNGQLLKLERDVYQILIGENVADSPIIPLNGGFAWADDAKANELKLSKVRA
jgi:syntaxin-binding protein 5